MGQDTAIEWADDTANFWEGCTQIAPPCDFCYAKTRAERFGTVAWNGPPRFVKAGAATLRRANQRAILDGRKRLVFINSISDTFDKNAPPEWRRAMFDAIRESPNIIALILTKRISIARRMIEDAGGWPVNAALGATVALQREADRDVPRLIETADALRINHVFLSCEPLLGPLALRPRDDFSDAGHGRGWLRSISAVIVGGESGPNARPMHPEWVRSIRDQCAQAGTPFHFKQWGEWAPISEIDDVDSLYHPAPERDPDATRRPRYDRLVMHTNGDLYNVAQPHAFSAGFGGMTIYRVGKKNAGRRIDGQTHDDFLPVDRSIGP